MDDDWKVNFHCGNTFLCEIIVKDDDDDIFHHRDKSLGENKFEFNVKKIEIFIYLKQW